MQCGAPADDRTRLVTDLIPRPVVATVVRSGFVEGHHHGSVIALQSEGSAALSVGVPDEPMLPRSCLKPLQAVGMLRAGLMVDDAELALVCASHSGSPSHIEVVRRLLARAGLDDGALDNTPSMPLDAEAARALIRAGEGPSPIVQNCSGKHAGMLATCVSAGWPTSGYRDPSHPLQQALRAAVEELAREPVVATVVDGCGAPMFAISLTGLARAFATLASAAPGSPERRCFDAMRAHPDLVGGHERDVTELMRGVPGLVAKDGAEGVYAAAMNDGRAAAVKIDDGAARARLPVLIAALRALGVTAPVLDELGTTPVLGHGKPVGAVQAAF
jgi:L-asparaginase II